MEEKSRQPYGTFQMLTIVQIVVPNKFFCRLSKNFAKNLAADLPKKKKKKKNRICQKLSDFFSHELWVECTRAIKKCLRFKFCQMYSLNKKVFKITFLSNVLAQ